jgi:hypothetical protein
MIEIDSESLADLPFPTYRRLEGSSHGMEIHNGRVGWKKKKKKKKEMN